ncbi:hypothetical protein Acr_18g0004470 [Actinidia rufa]|uniref:Uncharacterized protein n=1 Tax=Actinidia rufa TaxID=165716 RepID=A0A7J0G680_9ERIC|nr:hypothetical protein Acr_18g0004470 [Actinidia rufa]
MVADRRRSIMQVTFCPLTSHLEITPAAIRPSFYNGHSFELVDERHLGANESFGLDGEKYPPTLLHPFDDLLDHCFGFHRLLPKPSPRWLSSFKLTCFFSQNINLNRVQLLVCDDRALENFRADHSVPVDPDAKEGDGALPPYLYAAQEGAGQPFLQWQSLPASEGSQPTANEEFRPRDDGLWSFPRYNGSILDRFNDKFKFRFDNCKESIRAANNSLPPLRIEGRAPQREAFSHEVSGREKGYAMSSLGRNSLDHIGDEREEETSGQLILNKRRSQMGLVPNSEGTPFLVPVSSLDNEDDLVCALRLSVCETRAAGTSLSEGRCHEFGATGVDSGSLRVSMPGKRKGKEPLEGTPKRPWKETSFVGVAKLWKPEFFICELDRQVTVTDYARDLDTSLAHVHAVMLPSDSATLADEPWDLMRNLLVMQHVQVNVVISLLPDLAVLGCQLCVCNPGLSEGCCCRGCSCRASIGGIWPLCMSGFSLEGQSGKGQQQQAELDVPEDNPIWVQDAPAPMFPESPTPYSQLILLGFDEEEFLNRLEEDEVAPEPVPGLTATLDIKVADLAEEVRGAVAEASWIRTYSNDKILNS